MDFALSMVKYQHLVESFMPQLDNYIFDIP